jgi:DNA-binding IclR family transcriptional regulator
MLRFNRLVNRFGEPIDMRPTEIAKALGIDRASVYRVLEDLQSSGVVL